MEAAGAARLWRRVRFTVRKMTNKVWWANSLLQRANVHVGKYGPRGQNSAPLTVKTKPAWILAEVTCFCWLRYRSSLYCRGREALSFLQKLNWWERRDNQAKLRPLLLRGCPAPLLPASPASHTVRLYWTWRKETRSLLSETLQSGLHSHGEKQELRH